MSDAELTRFTCPHCDKRVKARLAPTVTQIRCPNPQCGKQIPIPERPAEAAAPDEGGFAWTGLQDEAPAKEQRPTTTRSSDKADGKGKPDHRQLFILAGAAGGLLLLLVTIGAVVGVLVSRRTAKPQAAAPKTSPPPDAPRQDTSAAKNDPKPPPPPPPLTVEIVRAEPERPRAGDDLRVWLRGGRPGGKAPLFQYRTDRGPWLPATGDQVHLRAVAEGMVTLQFRAVEGDDTSVASERTWDVERVSRPPTVEIVRLAPEKLRSGGSLFVQVKGKHPDNKPVKLEYRTDRNGAWADVAGDGVSLENLKEGALRFEVRARDDGGLTSEALVREWVVAAVPVTKDPARKYAGHRQCSHGVAFVPGGSKFLSGSCDRTLMLWDASDQNFLVRFEGTAGGIFALDVSPDGRYAATGGQDSAGKAATVQIWDLQTHKPIRNLKGHADRVSCVKFSPDGAVLASGGSDGTVRLWDVEKGKEIRSLKENGAIVMAVAFSADGKRLLSAGSLRGKGAIRQWDRESGELLTQIDPPSKRVAGVAFLKDASRIISSSGRVFASETTAVDTHVRVWDATTKKEAGSFLGNNQGVTSLALTADGKYVFCASGDASMQLREVAGGSEVHRFEGHRKKVLCVAISRDSHYVVTGSEDGQLLLWDLPKEVHIPEKPR